MTEVTVSKSWSSLFHHTLDSMGMALEPPHTPMDEPGTPFLHVMMIGYQDLESTKGEREMFQDDRRQYGLPGHWKQE